MISGALTGRGKGNDTVLFIPKEVVTLNDGLLFCADPREHEAGFG